MEQIQNYASRIDMDINYLAWELRPTELDQLGLEDALGSFVREWSKTYDIEAEFHTSRKSGGRLQPDLETNLYRIVQEGLNNILKHANASSGCIDRHRAGEVVLIIGTWRGFDPNSPANRSPGSGLGLVGMRERTACTAYFGDRSHRDKGRRFSFVYRSTYSHFYILTSISNRPESIELRPRK